VAAERRDAAAAEARELGADSSKQLAALLQRFKTLGGDVGRACAASMTFAARLCGHVQCTVRLRAVEMEHRLRTSCGAPRRYDRALVAYGCTSPEQPVSCLLT
jgi:hypothetical protein